MRRHFFRRAAVVLGAVAVTLVGLSVLALWIAASPLGLLKVPPGQMGLVQVAVAGLLVLALASVLLVARGFRRMTAPVGEVLAALGQVAGELGRVADGDYAARVRERGPQEMRALVRAFNAMAERLGRQEEQRRRLLTDVSHELRTPLAVLQGNIEGMLDGVYPRDNARLSVVLDEARVLIRLTEDLRTLALAESLALRLARTPTHVSDLAQDAVTSFRAQAETAGVTLLLAAQPGLPSADVDPERMRQVLNNLLSNAIRYTPPGGTVSVRCAAEDGGRVVLSVIDTGKGIPAEDLPHIFDRFHKSRDSRGTGLGLAIARSLVQAHGGEIAVQSAPGEGTTIRVTLPVHPPS
jgi:two-component system sensor histidine kinase BaeS